MNKIIIRLITGLCLAVIVHNAHAQPEKPDLAMVKKIMAEEKAHSQMASLAHQLTDVCGPRLTNSPGYNRAVSWVTQIFKEWGLQNAGPEAYGTFGKGWSTEHVYMAMTKPYYQPVIM